MASMTTRLAGCLACLALFAACEGGTGPEREVVAARIEPENSFPETDSIGAVLANVAVVVTDSTGGGVGGVTVHWSAGDGGSVTPATSVTGPMGVATTTWKLGTVAGSQYLTASVPGQATGQVRAIVSHGAPAAVELSADSLVIGALGEALPVHVLIRDRGGNAFRETIQWTVRDEPLARVDRMAVGPDSFRITPRTVGSTYAVAQVGSARDSVLVRVPAWASITTDHGRTCALTAAGVPFCWGSNANGVLGDGTTADRASPTRVSTSDAYSRLSLGRHFTCGLTTAGAAYCWGASPYGEVGSGDEVPQSLAPRAVVGGHAFATLSSGFSSSCGLTAAGDAWCWGVNLRGELGRDTITDTCSAANVDRCSSVPLAASGGVQFTRVSVGEWDHTCALTAAGEAWCWGQNVFNQLGTAAPPQTCLTDTACQRAPARVETALVFTRITTGFNFTCALDTGGTAWCWGSEYGPRPVAVPGGLVLADIDAGARVVCGRNTAGVVYCWGGPLGTLPVTRIGQPPVQSLSVGEAWTDGVHARVCGIGAGGAARCWAANSAPF